MEKKYKRVLLKLSGESLGDVRDGVILNKPKLEDIVLVIKKLVSNNIGVGVVVGAGNIFRGRISSQIGVDTISGDYMGMIGTVVNCISISSLLTKNNIKNVVFSALDIDIKDVVTPYNPKKANDYLKKGYVCLYAGGIGKPNFTTDTCAAMRAIETNASLILAGKNGIDGVYDDDPNVNKKAKFLKYLTYNDIIKRKLKVMDLTAIELLKDTDIVTRVFSMDDINNFIKVIDDESIGTIIKK